MTMPDFGPFQTADFISGYWVVRDMTPEELAIAFPPPPPPAPPTLEQQRAAMSLTFAQLLIGLVAEEWITEAEGEAWLTGTTPTAVNSLIMTLPTEQRFAAKARAVRPSIVLRNDPLVTSLAVLQSKTPEQMDLFFTTYAQV